MAEKAKILNDMAAFTCPKCVKTKIVNVSKYLYANQQINVRCKCPCGNTFTVFLDRRQFSREEIQLPGIYILYSDGKETLRGQMVVSDISASGLKLTIPERRHFEIGDLFLVVFNLDDQDRSLIKKEVIVRNIHHPSLGIEFRSVDEMNKVLYIG
jgi:c-di-GMP-binding flagellar brake protein YcgR